MSEFEMQDSEHSPDCLCDECWEAFKRAREIRVGDPSAPGVPGDMGTDPSRRVDRE